MKLERKGPTSGDGETLYTHVEQQKITKDHPSCSRMSYTRDLHRSGPGGTEQVRRNVCRNLQVTRHAPPLPSSCYAAAEVGVDSQAHSALVTDT